MKYLKSINEHNNIEILDNLEDICLSLKDMGFEIKLKSDNFYFLGTDNDYITISINKSDDILRNGEDFHSNFTNDIVTVLLTLNDYMKSKGWTTDYKFKQTYSSGNQRFYVKADKLITQDYILINDKSPIFVSMELTFRKKVNKKD